MISFVCLFVFFFFFQKSKSNMTQLTLLSVDPSLSGVYNCEVSAESPSFHTELKSGEMNVVGKLKKKQKTGKNFFVPAKKKTTY